MHGKWFEEESEKSLDADLKYTNRSIQFHNFWYPDTYGTPCNKRPFWHLVKKLCILDFQPKVILFLIKHLILYRCVGHRSCSSFDWTYTKIGTILRRLNNVYPCFYQSWFPELSKSWTLKNLVSWNLKKCTESYQCHSRKPH